MTTEAEEFNMSLDKVIEKLFEYHEGYNKDMKYLPAEKQAKFLEIYAKFVEFINFLKKNKAGYLMTDIEIAKPQWMREYEKQLKEFTENFKKHLTIEQNK